MKLPKIKLIQKKPPPYDMKVYNDPTKHTPVIIFGPDDFEDYGFFKRKCNKVLGKRFQFVQVIYAAEQKSTTEHPVELDECLRQVRGIAAYADEWAVRAPFDVKLFPPIRRIAHMVWMPKGMKGRKGQIRRSKAMFRKAKECSTKKPFALIFDDRSDETKLFIKMTKKRKIRRVIIKVH